MTKKITLNNGLKIEMREPKVRDMRYVSEFKDELEKEVNLIAILTGLTVEEIDELSLADYGLLQKGITDFLL